MEPTLRSPELLPIDIERPVRLESRSAVSWSAIFGGAFAGASVTLILLALGAGFGLSAISPFGDPSRLETPLAASAIVWLLLTQAASAALGGYLAGRLRTKWVGIHGDETHFRDTVHGFLAWAVSAVMCATLLGASLVSLAGSRPQPSNAAAAADSPAAYYVDSLLRGPSGIAPASDAVRGETRRLFTRLMLQPDPGDRTRLTQIVSAFADTPPADAYNRVDSVLLAARQAADETRRQTARLLLWASVALLLGAYLSSHAATIGGRHRMRAEVV